MALNSLSVDLHRTGYGYWKGLLHTVRTCSDDVQMFGLDKCATAHFVNGKLSGHNSGVTVGKRTPSTAGFEKPVAKSPNGDLCHRNGD